MPNLPPKMKKTPSTNTPANSLLGAKDFTDMMYAGHPEWSLLAVRAPVEEVTHAFADFRKAKRVLRDVPKEPSKKHDSISPLTCVVEVLGTGWSVVLRSLHYARMEELAGVADEAQTLSAQLKTKAISFVGEDTSCAVAYELYDGGQLVERAEWEPGADDFSGWGSKLRKKPRVEALDLDFADAVFRDQNIYIPICYARTDGKKTCLAVDKRSAPAIGRADLVEIGRIPAPDFKEIMDRMARKMAALTGKSK